MIFFVCAIILIMIITKLSTNVYKCVKCLNIVIVCIQVPIITILLLTIMLAVKKFDDSDYWQEDISISRQTS